MNETISQINVNGTLYDIAAASGGSVTSVVSQTGDVTATQIATALTNGGYKLTDNNTWTAASTSAAGYVPAATKGKFLHSNASTGALEWVDDNNSTYTAGTGLSLSGAQFSLATSGVTAGTYKRVTVDQYGRVTSGDNTDANDNTWRKVQLDGVDKLGTGTGTNPLNIKAGSNMTITESNGTFTFASSYSNAVSSVAGNTGAVTAAQIATALTTAGYKLTDTDTNTTYTAGTGLSLTGTEFALASGVATAGTAGTSSATSGSTLAVPYVTVDTYGRVTGYGTHTHTVSGFLTSHQDISGKANTADLATVATSGSYNDLSDKPTIPTVPTLATVATSGLYKDLSYTVAT